MIYNGYTTNITNLATNFKHEPNSENNPKVPHRHNWYYKDGHSLEKAINLIKRRNYKMDLNSWEEVRKAVEDEEQEICLIYNDEEWWISRLYGEEESFLLTRSKDSYTQRFNTAKELFNKGIVDGKPFIERIEDFY